MDAITRPRELHDRWAGRGAPDGQVALSELGPPVPAPMQVFGYGLNYRDHIEELDREDPLGSAASEAPVVFTKFPTCLVGPGRAGEAGRRPLRLRVRTGGGDRYRNQQRGRGPSLGPGDRSHDRPGHLRPRVAVGGHTGPVQPGQVQGLIRPNRPCTGKRRLGGQSRRSGHLLPGERRAAPEQPHQLPHAPGGRDGLLLVVDSHAAPRRCHLHRHPRRGRPRPRPLPQAR